MNIQAIAKSATDLGFRIAGKPEDGGVLVSVTLKLGTARKWDAVTETYADQAGALDITVDALMSSREEDETNEVTKNDMHLLINQTDIEDVAGPEPNVHTARQAIVDGISWNIVTVKPTGAQRMYRIRIRK